MIQQAYKYGRSSTWPWVMVFMLKMLKVGSRVLEKSGLPWEHYFYSHRCVACKTISVPSLSFFAVYILDVTQWNPVNADIKGTCHSVRIIWVSVLTRLSEKTPGTHVLSKKSQSTQFYERTLFNFLTTSLRVKSFTYCFGIETGMTMDSFEKSLWLCLVLKLLVCDAVK